MAFQIIMEGDGARVNEVLGWRFADCFIGTFEAGFKESVKGKYIKAGLGSALQFTSSIL
jgi:hypothetical protein